MTRATTNGSRSKAAEHSINSKKGMLMK